MRWHAAAFGPLSVTHSICCDWQLGQNGDGRHPERPADAAAGCHKPAFARNVPERFGPDIRDR
jgi:hypothetical protein